VLPNAQQTGLPPGWTITVNTGSAITVCNGADPIAVGEARTVLIAVQGNTLGGPSTVTANLLFSSGTSCTAPGSLPGDQTSDNGSTSSIQVVTVTPLTLIGFTAKLTDCQPVLNWVTENEINTDRFEIEKSNLNNPGWKPVGIITAKGNSSAKSEYTFTDKNQNLISGQSLYRLKMIDKDGRYDYSKTLNVANNCKTIQADVYPNPANKGKLYVRLTGINEEKAEAMLVSLSGQVIVKSKMKNGINFLNTSNIAAGEYLLRIKDGNDFSKTVKVIIEN
jgi:Secretion system C-terminal sorting domain